MSIHPEWIRGAISSAIPGPGEFAHKSLGKIHRQSGIDSLGLTPRGRLQWNTPEVSAGHARGFSGASVEHAPGFSGGGVLELLAPSDSLGKSW